MRYRRVRIAAAVAVLAAAAAHGVAGELRLPPGRWWNDPELGRRLELTGEQRHAIQEAVYRHAERMIDLNAAVRHRELELARLVDGPEWNEAAVRRTFAALQEARAALERERFELLLEVRTVLTAEQWSRLRALRKERRRAHHPRRPRPTTHRPK